MSFDSAPVLAIENLDVYYGRAHALQGVSLTLEAGVRAVVGRNGMGKTTLCNAVTGLTRASGSVRFCGEELLGLAPNRIARLGVAYVPQGRRVWPSLTVDEHLTLASRARKGPWTVARAYRTFPRLAERKSNGGAELSGGEQQMLAIARALLLNPRLLVMDEPTEGLAPVIVQQVEAMLKTLTQGGDMAVLLIEQNLGVAIAVAETINVMVNGRIARSLPAAELGADRELQQRLLGVRAAADAELAAEPVTDQVSDAASAAVRIYTVKRDGADALPAHTDERTVRGYTRWDTQAVDRPVAPPALQSAAPSGMQTGTHFSEQADAQPGTQPSTKHGAQAADDAAARVVAFPSSVSGGRSAAGQNAYVVGTFDTKGRELGYLRTCIEQLGVRVVTVDVSTSGKPSAAMVHAREVARCHPQGERSVFTGDRGTAVTGMALALEHYVARQRDLGGMIAAGGSGNTALATQAMRCLPVGVPKVMVSTVASGDVRPYVGSSDICMMYSVTDVAGINRISARVLANAAHALAGMIRHARHDDAGIGTRPALGITMFGLTTACVQALTPLLDADYDCIVFHATGTGGQSMEKLAESKLLSAVLDVTTTEIADEIAGGVLSAGPQRLDAIARAGLPYVGSCGALDMVNFWAMDTVPAKYRSRRLHQHNANVTLMRTTPEENTQIGRFIAAKLNRMEGPVRFLIPEGGLSGLDLPGGAFHDPAANRALFDALTKDFIPTAQRRLIRLPQHINDPAFAAALAAQLREIDNKEQAPSWPVSRAAQF